MIIDANASIGHWPFRAHRTRTAAELLARLDRLGVDRALVGSLSAVCYRDCMAGNEELFEQLAPHRDRLIPAAVLNPCYAGWQRDLDLCREQGCVAVRMYPNYHRYAPGGAEAGRLAGAAAERGMVLTFTCRLEDRRQRHWMDTPEDLTAEDIAAVVRPHPAARFLILEALGIESSLFAKEPEWRERRFGVDISRMCTVLFKSVQKLRQALGADKPVFGTGLPLKGPNAAVLKLDHAAAEERAAVAAGNLMALIGNGPA